MDDPRLLFFSGLFWYLETRNWALEKLRACPVGSRLPDIRMYHYLYFANVFGAIDRVLDFIKEIGGRSNFEDRLTREFQADDYRFARELRNAIVHRGLDPAASGHAVDGVLHILCPRVVQDRKGCEYSCTFQYTVQLAEQCNRASNWAIFEFVRECGLLEPSSIMIGREEAREAIENEAAMPDWAKAMSVEALQRPDSAAYARAIAESRVRRLKELLDQ